MKLTEIAFKQPPYNWTSQSATFGMNYLFKDKANNEYLVNIDPRPYGTDGGDNIAVSYGVKSGVFGKYDTGALTGANDVIKIMSTVVSIIATYLQENPHVKKVWFSPSEEGKGDSIKARKQRGVLYRAVAKAYGFTAMNTNGGMVIKL